MARLGVNIDHVATLRNARGVLYPNPLAAAARVEKAGGEQITVHLREDRRHIRDEDVKALRKTVSTSFNLEMAATPEMVTIACSIKPDTVTLVPEQREELTTEGGLDAVKLQNYLGDVVHRLKQAGIEVSLFIEPDLKQIDAAVHLGVDHVEFHTGRYCGESHKEGIQKELARLKESVQYSREKGLFVAAGHGLNYDNIEDIVREIPEIEEYNIGHGIVSRALFVGLEKAVEEMKILLKGVSR